MYPISISGNKLGCCQTIFKIIEKTQSEFRILLLSLY